MQNKNDRIANSGYVNIAAVDDPRKIVKIGVNFKADSLVLSRKNNVYTVITNEQGYIVRNTKTNKSITCKTYKKVFGYISRIPSNNIAVEYGEINIGDITFLLYLLLDGVSLKLDLGVLCHSFIITRPGGTIIVAHKEGEWTKNVIKNEDILRTCKDYNDALLAVHDYCKNIVKEVLSVPNIIN